MKTNKGRRTFLGHLGAAAALPFVVGAAEAQDPNIGRQLPLRTTGLEHFGITVPDVSKAGKFYGAIFNPDLHKENSEPLRYYVSMGIGYIALGMSRQQSTPPRIDHYCALVDGYNAQAFKQELEAQGITVNPGGAGMIGDADGLQPQLLGIPGGLARTTVPAGRIS